MTRAISILVTLLVIPVTGLTCRTKRPKSSYSYVVTFPFGSVTDVT